MPENHGRETLEGHHRETPIDGNQVFADAERPALRPLPAARFRWFDELRRTVNRDWLIEIGRVYDSVPSKYLGGQSGRAGTSSTASCTTPRSAVLAARATACGTGLGPSRR
jgi:hypothetical protein